MQKRANPSRFEILKYRGRGRHDQAWEMNVEEHYIENIMSRAKFKQTRHNQYRQLVMTKA